MIKNINDQQICKTLNFNKQINLNRSNVYQYYIKKPVTHFFISPCQKKNYNYSLSTYLIQKRIVYQLSNKLGNEN